MKSEATRRFKLAASQDVCDRMNAELDDAPTYVISIKVSSDEITLASSSKPSENPALTTDTAIVTPGLSSKLSDYLPSLGAASPLRYETVGDLGEGGSGKVYEMFDSNIKRQVAVKVLKSQTRVSEMTQFLNEGIVAAEMEHPNIIPVYDLDVDENGRMYMTMKKVEGKSLASLLKLEGAVDLENLLLISLKVCDALSFAHSRGKIHQDVKPENIMLGDYGEVFLIDWGASSGGGDDIQVSPVYMSPQQAEGMLSTVQDDVYCLGATLFHVLTKRFPTNAKTIEALWKKKLSGVIDPFTSAEQKQIPPRVRAIVLKALAFNPEHRYQTIDGFASDLKNYQADRPVSAYRDSLSDRFNRFYRKHHTICHIIATCIGVLALATGYYLFDLNREKAEKFKAIAETERAEAEKLRAVEVARQRENERMVTWHPVHTADFVRDKTLSENWDCNGVPLSDEGGLRFGLFSDLTEMIWKTPIEGQKKLEMEYECQTAPYLEVILSGSRMGNGIRLRIGHAIELYEKMGQHDRSIAYSAASTDHFRYDQPNRLTIYQRVNRYVVTLNGKDVLDHYDALGPRRMDYQFFGISRPFAYSPCNIRSLRLHRIIPPDYINSLVVGKMFLLGGKRAVAERWFSNFVRRSPNSDLVPEALLLLSKCMDTEQKEEEVLRRLLAHARSRSLGYAFHRLAQLQAERGNISKALEYCRGATKAAPELGTVNAIIAPLTPHLVALATEDRRPYITELLDLSQASYCDLDGAVNLGTILHGNLDLLKGARFRTLNLSNSSIAEVALLEETVMDSLSIRGSKVADVAPLKGKKLFRLDISGTPVADLSPLHGHRFDSLYLNDCRNLDLSTLKGVQAHLLSLNGVPIPDPNALSGVRPLILRAIDCNMKDIEFVRGKRYFELRLDGNQIKEISPLSETEIRTLSIRDNQISDLRPLNSCGVLRLDLSGNPIADLKPLAGLPLRRLDISNTLIRDATPLKSMKRLNVLVADQLQLDKEALGTLAELPIADLTVNNDLQYLFAVSKNRHLKTLNGFPIAHARPVLAELNRVLSTPKSSRTFGRLKRLGRRCPDGREILFLPVRMDFQSAEQLARRLGGQLVTDGDDDHMAFLAGYVQRIIGPWANVWISPKGSPEAAKNGQPTVFRPSDRSRGTNGISKDAFSKGGSGEWPLIVEWD